MLVIECKHLQYHKTYGEIAEQLSDYRGEVKGNGKRDDLRKHLDRIAILKRYRNDLCKTLNCDNVSIEGWIIFKNPVPMLYMWDKLRRRIEIATFDDLGDVIRKPR